MNERDRELSTAVEDLAETLKRLREEIDEPPRGPLGVPRPPTPGELLRFTEQYTIPTLIALLESAIRTLELLGAAIRLADGRQLGEAKSGRLAAGSRATLSALDDALAEIQATVEGGEPSNPELRRMLEQARELRAEVDERLAAAGADADAETGQRFDAAGEESEHRPKRTTIGVTDAERSTPEDTGVDVDAELASIKREVDGRTDENDRNPNDDADGIEGENEESDGRPGDEQ